MPKPAFDAEKHEKWFAFMQTLNSDLDPAILQLMDKMRMVGRALYQKGEHSLAEAGLSYARFHLLMKLLFNEEVEGRGELNPSEISSKQGISRNTVSSLIRELENEKLIERHLDHQDRRRFNICLTDKGRAVVKEHACRHFQAIANNFNGLTTTEQQQLSQLLNKLHEKLE